MVKFEWLGSDDDLSLYANGRNLGWVYRQGKYFQPAIRFNQNKGWKFKSRAFRTQEEAKAWVEKHLVPFLEAVEKELATRSGGEA